MVLGRLWGSNGDPALKASGKRIGALSRRGCPRAEATGPFKAPREPRLGSEGGGSKVPERPPRDSDCKFACEFDRSLNRTRGLSPAGGAARWPQPRRAQAAAPPRPTPPAWIPARRRARASSPQLHRGPRSLPAREPSPGAAPRPRRASMSSTESSGRTADKSPRQQVRPARPGDSLTVSLATYSSGLNRIPTPVPIPPSHLSV